MKKIFSLVVFVAVASCVGAQEVSLWSRLLPGYRKALAVDNLPERLFGVKIQINTEENPNNKEDTRLQEAVAKVGALPVTGLVWSDDSKSRRVLMGDVVLREGQAIPSYVFNDGRFYTLVGISQNSLSFSMQEGSFGSAVNFEIPFGLTEPIKNSSKYSNGQDQK